MMRESLFLVWRGTETTITEAWGHYCILYQPQMMMDDECGAIHGMNGMGNLSAWRKPALVQLCPPQIQHELKQARTLVTMVGSWRPTVWAKAWSIIIILHKK
jgi:hypothetical protein